MSYTKDRNNRPNQALSLNPGYLKLPGNIFSNGNFTFSMWINMARLLPNTTILDCGNGAASNNVLITLPGVPNPGSLRIGIFTGTRPSYENTCKTINTNDWHFLVFTSEGDVGTLYLNGIVWAQGVMNRAISIARRTCYLGRSNWWIKNSVSSESANVFATFDDIKVHSRALSPNEVDELMNS
jgi:hypothetical protein